MIRIEGFSSPAINMNESVGKCPECDFAIVKEYDPEYDMYYAEYQECDLCHRLIHDDCYGKHREKCEKEFLNHLEEKGWHKLSDEDIEDLRFDYHGEFEESNNDFYIDTLEEARGEA